MFDIKAHVKDRVVRFVAADRGNLWYETELGLRFPVPFEDMGDATFLAEDRAMLFMRYIRRHGEAGAPFAIDGGAPEDAARFTHARAGNLWYVSADGFEFPVPFDRNGGLLRAREATSELREFLLDHEQRSITARLAAGGA